MQPIIDHSILAKTRAEEHDADVWGKFFIPPYFESLGLKKSTKSTYLVGKRGCGKTMLLKYLDYHTLFSERRSNIPENETEHIGIYWRVDTQFCNSLKLRGIDDESWTSIFESYFSLVIAIEILKSVQVIANSDYSKFSLKDFNGMRINSASDFHHSFPQLPLELVRHLESTRRAFSLWISNLSTVERPLLPPGKDFLDSIIQDIRSTPGLESSNFFVYVDEVENLVPYQRRALNSFLKHSQRPLIVNFTSKELSDENMTSGQESINATHDYNLVSIDNLMNDPERMCFFAEVFLSNLDIAAENLDSSLLNLVRDQGSVTLRKGSQHREQILTTIRKKFPTKEYKQFAQDAFDEPRIRSTLHERVSRALQSSDTTLSVDDFISDIYPPEAIVILPALLNRKTLKPSAVLQELKDYHENKAGNFQKSWVHNNLFGSLLELYRPYRKTCPLYSGFDTFYNMANRNLRHFLILCYKSLDLAELEDLSGDIFPIEIQARAAYEASDQLIREIKTFGELGEQLRSFVLRLGNLFRAQQSAPSMSEPEQNQFTINSGDRPLNEKEIKLLSESQKYAILIEMLETKTKGIIGTDTTDFQLNPIYSPYFLISYRRKRKIELSVERFNILAFGTESQYKELVTTAYKNSETVQSSQLGLSL